MQVARINATLPKYFSNCGYKFCKKNNIKVRRKMI